MPFHLRRFLYAMQGCASPHGVGRRRRGDVDLARGAPGMWPGQECFQLLLQSEFCFGMENTPLAMPLLFYPGFYLLFCLSVYMTGFVHFPCTGGRDQDREIGGEAAAAIDIALVVTREGTFLFRSSVSRCWCSSLMARTHRPPHTGRAVPVPGDSSFFA
jgi:hypothetical protein